MQSSRPPDPYPDEDFRFRLGTAPGNVEAFFAPSSRAESVLAERRAWLSSPEPYAGLLPEGVAILDEFLSIVATWKAHRHAFVGGRAGAPLERLIDLGGRLEPDFVLMASDGRSRYYVAGGCVCFPSSWRLADKLGRPLEEVHAPVPGLNAAMGVNIDRLMAGIRAGRCLVRANWSACRQPERNQHLDRSLPGLSPPLDPDEVWLRREDQALFALPETGGVIFGIAISHLSWRAACSDPAIAIPLARALRTMPDAMLDYKRLLHVRDELVRMLEAR